jgi:hypothetical protein
VDVHLLDRPGWSNHGNVITVPKKITERSVEATIKTLVTKDDIASVISEMRDAKAATIKWMFVFWIGQVGATLAIVFLFLKK